jgi:REP element-mobilizing transposase RayT
LPLLPPYYSILQETLESIRRIRGMSYRIMPPNHPYEVTISLEQGILLPANALCRFIIASALARAQALYPVTLCHFLVEGSHIHLLVYVQDPNDLTSFVGHFKTESAHYINAMLGRRKRTVWCESFCALPILTLSSVINKIVYIYTNPAKDDLESSIEIYPGLSSWQAYRTGKLNKSIKRLHRPMIPYLPERAYSQYEYKRQIKKLKSDSRSSHVLTLKPNGWMKFFDISDKQEIAEINQQIVDQIKVDEREFERLRALEGKSVLGATKLSMQHLNPDYMPEREGQQMWCVCDDVALRISFINWAKELKELARATYQRWKQGDFSVSFPPGVFPPAVPKLSNMTALGCDY